MTTANIIATLRQGAPVTSRLVREIITHLERLDWAERSLKAALEKYGAETVPFTRDECGYVCEALEESERLKEAVRWERECRGVWTWLNNTLSNVRADLEIQRSTLAASTAVEELL